MGLISYFTYLDKCQGFRLELVDEFTNMFPSALEPFMDHHQGLFACVKISFLKFFVFFMILKFT